MSSTTFTDGVTVIRSSWLNDVNTAVYTGVFPNASLVTTNFTWGGYAIPAPTGSTTTFLRNDGTWQTPAGSGIGTVTSVGTASGQLTGGPITSSGTIGLATTAVAAGSYTSANITVDAYGRITAASNGTGGSTPSLAAVCAVGNSYSGSINIGSVSTFNGVGIGSTSSGPTGTAYGIATASSVIGIGNSTSSVYLYASAFIPQTSTTFTLGSSAYQWGSLYLSGTFAWNSYNISAPSGSTSTFLRNDGTWATPSTSGGVSSFNTRTGAVTLTSSDVTTALGYTPLNGVPTLQSVLNSGNSATGDAIFGTSSGYGVAIGIQTGTGYYGISSAATTIGFQNNSGGSPNTILLQNATLVPYSAAGISLGSSSNPFASLTVTSSGTATAFSSPTNIYVQSTEGIGVYVPTTGNGYVNCINSSYIGSSNHVLFAVGTPTSFTTAGAISSPTSSSVNYGTTSDRRLKTNIVNYANSGAVIDALQPRSFTWIGSGVADIGFIADEVQSVVAGAVSGSANAVDGEGKPIYQMVDLSAPEMMANIVAELKSLRARLKAANIA